MMGKRRPRAGTHGTGAREEGVALLSAIFFMVLAAGLSVVLLGAILSQSAPALVAQKNTRTIYSAQAGLQAALGLIRTSADTTTGNGTTADLPCAVTGRVTASGTGASYSATVEYFTVDPTNSSVDWRLAHRLTCAAPGGVTNAGAPVTPKYAYVYSGGKDAATAAFAPVDGDRALSAVYKFKVTNVNIPGGMIYNDNKQYCLEAASAATGSALKFTKVTATTCTNTDLQRWVYGVDYELKLASTVIPASPTTGSGSPGMCITGPVTSTDDNQPALLRPCLATTARWNQLWSWTGDYSWVGQTPSITAGPSVYCLSTGVANGSNLDTKQLFVNKTNPLSPRDPNGCLGEFSPSSSVGAGAASYDTNQIVNYLEFGRCADVTSADISSGYMISFPCKQDPSGVAGMPYILWNHKWFYTEPPAPPVTVPPTAPVSTYGPQQIYVLKDNDARQRYCLTSPVASASSGELTFTACTATSTTTRQTWKRVKDTGDYGSSYLFVDSQNRCMGVDTGAVKSGTADIHLIRAMPCNALDLGQKWNAPATYVSSTVGSYREVGH
ncbi:hypothetical protein E3O44_08075 [Cryobacterium algoricola]|uniref:Ricin B lectin domain-containing protein n=1 Tax=Cryobacterium algoricola TaxID=1259183 RepID=A0ABY2IBY5_9MICO|nr:hypothetical protein [Cryobacterium algoricola]TFB87095.1 hypothetical protein E3O44_08075 [Cryobacterium algoricola]